MAGEARFFVHYASGSFVLSRTSLREIVRREWFVSPLVGAYCADIESVN